MNNQIICQRYKILKKLGEGGFGTTYLAEDVQMPSHRRCVVKQLKPLNHEPQIYQLIKERFGKEAAILEELGSQNRQIPQLYAYFEDQGQFYLVQEYVDGDTFSSLVEQKGLLDENTVKEILLKLLPVLDYVHNHRIVHRDIKPDNIILRHSDNSPVLIDFGAVKESMGTVMTPTGSPTGSIIIGTPGFMPSEQSAGRPVYATDVYALGLTAIYLLTGKMPQELETDPLTGEIIWKLYAPQISATLAEVLDKAIKSFHKERFSTAKAMLEALGSSSAATVVVSPLTQETQVTQAASAQRTPSSGVNWGKNLLIGGIIALPLILGVYYWQNRGEQTVQTEDTLQESQQTQTEDPIVDRSPTISTQKTFEHQEPVASPSPNQFESLNFPQPSCGESLPTDASSYPLDVYPIFIEFSQENLQIIQTNYCQDAFEKIRNDTGVKAIQVASFYNFEKAREFSEFINNKVGSGEIGKPTLIAQPPEQTNINQENGESSLSSSPPYPEGENLDENRARQMLENFYSLASEKRYEEARQLFDTQLEAKFDSSFFDKFTQISIEDLQITSRTDSTIYFEGKNTYIYPDGSTQEELRSYTVENIDGEPKIIASEMLQVIKFR